MTQDSSVQQMAEWTREYGDQCKSFNGERHKQYEKAMANLHLLMDNKMDTYAIDEAASAYTLSDDKDNFSKQQWVVDLMKESAAAADADESHQQWLEAARLYSDLCSLEPSVSSWNDKFDLAMRRVTLLMMYAR